MPSISFCFTNTSCRCCFSSCYLSSSLLSSDFPHPPSPVILPNGNAFMLHAPHVSMDVSPGATPALP
eukprot:3780072-Pyramimonas_sp.AAC.1